MPKKPRGRPKKVLDKDDISQLKRMAGFGMPLDQMAAIIGISDTTLDRLIKRDPAIKDAISKGRATASNNVRQTAYTMAVSGKCPAMTIFWLKVRERWKEPVEVENETDGGFEFKLNYALPPKEEKK